MVPEVFWQQICYEIPVSSILRSILQQPLPLHGIAGGFRKSSSLASRLRFKVDSSSANTRGRTSLCMFA
jgi:hypothetical protein